MFVDDAIMLPLAVIKVLELGKDSTYCMIEERRHALGSAVWFVDFSFLDNCHQVPKWL